MPFQVTPNLRIQVREATAPPAPTGGCVCTTQGEIENYCGLFPVHAGLSDLRRDRDPDTRRRVPTPPSHSAQTKGPEPWHAPTHRSDSWSTYTAPPPWRPRPTSPSPASPVTAPGSRRRLPAAGPSPGAAEPVLSRRPGPVRGRPAGLTFWARGAGSLRRPPHVRTRPAGGPRRRRRRAVLKEAKVLGGSEGRLEVTKVSRVK